MPSRSRPVSLRGRPAPRRLVHHTGVTRDHQIQPLHPERGESWNHGGSPQIHAPGKRRPTVEEEGGPSPLDDDRTALSDVEQRGAFGGIS